MSLCWRGLYKGARGSYARVCSLPTAIYSLRHYSPNTITCLSVSPVPPAEPHPANSPIPGAFQLLRCSTSCQIWTTRASPLDHNVCSTSGPRPVTSYTDPLFSIQMGETCLPFFPIFFMHGHVFINFFVSSAQLGSINSRTNTLIHNEGSRCVISERRRFRVFLEARFSDQRWQTRFPYRRPGSSATCIVPSPITPVRSHIRVSVPLACARPFPTAKRPRLDSTLPALPQELCSTDQQQRAILANQTRKQNYSGTGMRGRTTHPWG